MDNETKRMIALKEELRRDLEAIERVERLMALKNGSISNKDERQTVLPINISLEDSLAMQDEDEDQDQGTSLKGAIAATINADPAMRWTNRKMLTHLQQIGFKLRAQKPIYSIGQAMQKLCDAGDIRIVRKGAGNLPNVYKAKKEQPVTMDAPSETEQGAGQAESRVVQ
jgi:hypothetical protein